MNPYNCTLPGRLFVGLTELRQELLTGCRNGNSYAILGGRRCGKTSLLLQLQHELETTPDALAPCRALPRFLDIQAFNELTPALLFETLYGLTTQGTAAPVWEDGKAGREYQHFLSRLDAANAAITAQYGANWLVVLLIDELDGALKKLPDDQFFQNLRNLLTVSRFSRHFRVIAVGVKDLSRLIFSGSSPLNNLLHEYLRVLRGAEIDALIEAGFAEGLNSQAVYELLQLTGGHPYLLQGLLERLWQMADNPAAARALDRAAVASSVAKFLAQHHDFDHWLVYFGLPEHIVYQRLAAANDSALTLRDLRDGLNDALAGKVDDALSVLAYHGVIDDSAPDRPRLAGSMFRAWYAANSPIPHVESVLQGFEALQTEVAQLPVADSAKQAVQAALSQGLQELKKPETEGQPQKEVLKTSLEQATGIFKAAGETAETVEKFISIVKQIGPWVGLATEVVLAWWPR